MKKLLIVISLFALVGCAQIDQTERGVILEFGKVDEVVGPGLTIYNCFFKDIVRIPVKTMLETTSIEAGSKDLQTVHVKSEVNYQIDPNFVDTVYSRYGTAVVATVLEPKIKETITGITPQYVPEEMMQKREEIRSRMERALQEKLDSAGAHIFVKGFTITEFNFSRAFNDAIEAKQVAEQEALKEKNVLDKVRNQNEQKVIAARADSTAKVIAAKADSVETAVKLEVLKKAHVKEYITLKWIETWDGKLPGVIANDKMMPIVDLK